MMKENHMTDRMDAEELRELAALDMNVRKDPDDAGGWFITAQGACRADMTGPKDDRERMARAMASGPSLAAEVSELRAALRCISRTIIVSECQQIAREALGE